MHRKSILYNLERSDAEQPVALRRQWPQLVQLSCGASAIGLGSICVRCLVTPPNEILQQRRHNKQKGLGWI